MFPCRSVPHIEQIPSKIGLAPTFTPRRNQRAISGVSSAIRFATLAVDQRSLCFSQSASKRHKSNRSIICGRVHSVSRAVIVLLCNFFPKSSTRGALGVPCGRMSTVIQSFEICRTVAATSALLEYSPSNITRQPSGRPHPGPTCTRLLHFRGLGRGAPRRHYNRPAAGLLTISAYDTSH